MLLEKHQRYFLRHELRFRPRREKGEPLELISNDSDLVDVVYLLKNVEDKEGGRVVLRNQDMVQLTKVDVRPDDNLVVLLFRRSDPDAATPMYEHRTTRKVRKSDKADDEAVAVSAHVFIHTENIHSVNPTYRAIIEEVPGLGRTYIQNLLGNILRDFKYEYTDHRGHAKTTYTLVDFHGIKSDTLGGALKGGTIPYVELVRPANIEGLDTEGLIVPRDERLKLKFRAQSSGMLAAVRRIQEWAFGNDWKDVRVMVDMEENRSRLVSLAREADAADILFVRSVPINVPTALDVCTEIVNEELVAAALELFEADSA